jgi:capsular exopolysaccharide synthesis family protein
MYPTQDSNEVPISDYLDVLKRRWVWILFTPLLLVGLSLFRDLRAEPVYTAKNQMLLQSKASEDIFGLSSAAVDPERALQNELRVVNSRRVREAVREEYGRAIGVRALAGGQDDVIILSADADSGELAAEKVNTYADVYQNVRLEALLEDLTDAKNVIQQQIDDFQSQIDELDAPLVLYDERLRTLDPASLEYQQLLEERDRAKQITDAQRQEAQTQLNDYRQRLQILQLSERLTTTGGVQILNPAQIPSSPVSPTPVRNAVQAFVIGLFIGVALAFLRDQLDESLRSKAEVERAVRGLPTIGLIPAAGELREGSQMRLVTLVAPMSAVAEAYRGLRTSLQYANLDQPLKVVQITSASASEGKSTLASNLAITFAQAGKRVLVIGADLRKPRLHHAFQVDGSVGFTSVVLGLTPLEEAIQTSPLHPNLDVLASGALPPNPSELLSHERTGRIIKAVSERYDMVFIDCPPVLPVTDALVLSRWVDATFLLVMANRTTRRTARRAVEMLRQVDSPLLGTVILGLEGGETYGSYYEYYGVGQPSRVPIIGRFLNRRQGDLDVGVISERDADGSTGPSDPSPDDRGPDDPAAEVDPSATPVRT